MNAVEQHFLRVIAVNSKKLIGIHKADIVVREVARDINQIADRITLFVLPDVSVPEISACTAFKKLAVTGRNNDDLRVGKFILQFHNHICERAAVRTDVGPHIVIRQRNVSQVVIDAESDHKNIGSCEITAVKNTSRVAVLGSKYFVRACIAADRRDHAAPAPGCARRAFGRSYSRRCAAKAQIENIRLAIMREQRPETVSSLEIRILRIADADDLHKAVVSI